MPDGARKEAHVHDQREASPLNSIRNCNFCGATRAITMPFDDRKAAAVDAALRCSKQTRVRLHVWISTVMPRRSVHRSLNTSVCRRANQRTFCIP